MLAGAYHLFEQGETVYLWLEVVLKDGLEGGKLGIHHQDVCRDARLAQLLSLVGYGYGKVVYTMVL